VDRNFLLATALSMAVLMLWTFYVEGNKPQEPAPEVVAAAEEPAPGGEPAAARPPAPAAASAPAPAAPAAPETPSVPEQKVEIRSDLFHAVLTSHGGALERWELLQFEDRSVPGRPNVEVTTLAEGEVALATPFAELGLGDLSRLPYAVSQPDPSSATFEAALNGLQIRKDYTFDPASYLFRLRIEIVNGTGRAIRPSFRTHWPARARRSDDFREYGLAIYTSGSESGFEHFPLVPQSSFLGFGGSPWTGVRCYDRNPPPDCGEPRPDLEVNWAGADTRYFLAALLPDNPRDASARLSSVESGVADLVEVAFVPTEIPPGERLDREVRVYLGPKEQERLDAVGGHLEEAIQRGWFPVLTRFFTWLLTSAHSVIPNYGVAIILITILVRLVLWPLAANQNKQMKKMAAIQPKMKAIQEKYANDRQKQSEAMMALYREAGMSPAAPLLGCLPMVLQLPVFIGFYYALQGAIQLRQQPFFGWIDDLSQPEALFTLPGIDLPVRALPILMAGSMVLQQRLTPSTMDPAQARMMLVMMPLMMLVMFYQFASGLVLYWFVSTLLGIAQQVWTNRRA
jgi:YidC/Oxa1 family membrane protein insertase